MVVSKRTMLHVRTQSLPLRLLLSGVWISCRAMSSSGSNVRRAAVAQLRSTSNKFDNLMDIAKCAGWAKRDGACMLFLPENFGFMGESSADTLQKAEPPVLEDTTENLASVTDAIKATVATCAEGGQPTKHDLAIDNLSLLDGLKTIARESDLWISGGGMQIRGAPPAQSNDSSRPRVYNTHIVLDNNGEVKCVYRKIHLFDVSIPGKVDLQESATTAPGSDLVVCDSPIGKTCAGERK
jgi:deaminated glutathione amidase